MDHEVVYMTEGEGNGNGTRGRPRENWLTWADLIQLASNDDGLPPAIIVVRRGRHGIRSRGRLVAITETNMTLRRGMHVETWPVDVFAKARVVDSPFEAAEPWKEDGEEKGWVVWHRPDELPIPAVIIRLLKGTNIQIQTIDGLVEVDESELVHEQDAVKKGA